jgi:hypothetical protein
MKYMIITSGYTWTVCKTNSHIAKEFEITPVLANCWNTRGTG